MPESMATLRLIVRRGVRRGFLSVIREEGFGTAVGSLFGVLLLGQLLLLLVFGVQSGLSVLREQTDLRLEIADTATDAQIQDLISNIRQLPYVQDSTYVTREQAYERQKQRDPTLIDFLTKFGIDNPFPETMGIRLKRLEDYGLFVAFLKQPVFSKVVNPAFLSQTTDQEQQIERLTSAVSAVESALIVFVGLLVLVTLFVVVELVRRRAAAKHEEILVEQLVGASQLAVLLPFSTEMLCLLGVALIVSVVCTGGVLYFLPFVLPSLAAGGMFSLWAGETASLLLSSALWILPLECLTIILISVLATFIALKPHMRIHALHLHRAA